MKTREVKEESYNFEYVELIFENGNSVKLYPKDIVNMSCIDITEHLIINYVGQFISIKTCRDFMIEIKEEALNNKTSLEEDFNTNEYFRYHVEEFYDLTHVVVKQADKEYQIAVPWESPEGNRFINIKQKHISLGDTFRIYCGETNKTDE